MVDRVCERISARSAQRIRNTFAPGVGDEVPTAGVDGGGGEESTGADPRDLWESRGNDHEGSRFERSRACLCIDTAANNYQPVGTAIEREDGVQAAAGVPAFEEEILGSAYLGARVFLLQQWEYHGRSGDAVY